MNDDKTKGKLDELKGDVKERIGGATKDRSLQGEGIADQVKGKIRGAVGEAKEEADRTDRKDPP